MLKFTGNFLLVHPLWQLAGSSLRQLTRSLLWKLAGSLLWQLVGSLLQKLTNLQFMGIDIYST